MSFYFKNFNFIDFKKEILSLLNSSDKKHGFDIESIYFLYLIEPNGAIVMKLPIKLSSLENNENVIISSYTAINCYLDQYIGNSILFNFDFHLKYTIYIGVYTDNYNIF